MSPPWGTGRDALYGDWPGRGGEWPVGICGWYTTATQVVWKLFFPICSWEGGAVVKHKKNREIFSFISEATECQVSLDICCPSWCFTAAAVVSKKMKEATEPVHIHRKPYRIDERQLIPWQVSGLTEDPIHLREVLNTRSVAAEEPQWHQLTNELYWPGRKKAVGIVLLPSPVQQNISSGRLCYCYLHQATCRSLTTPCGLWANTTRWAGRSTPHGSA